MTRDAENTSVQQETAASVPPFPTPQGWLGELRELMEELDEIAALITYPDVPELVADAARHLGMACDLIEAFDA